jgi:SEC-C motif domain protein
VKPVAALCPCGSGLAAQDCCLLVINGTPASTPEALMRSRYTAFALENEDYLRSSWHASTRPAGTLLAAGTRWSGLNIINTGSDGDQGSVSFVATFQEVQEKGWYQLQETSRFVREDGRWFYLDGDARWMTLRPGRNDECPCGSGKKYKKCCG